MDSDIIKRMKEESKGSGLGWDQWIEIEKLMQFKRIGDLLEQVIDYGSVTDTHAIRINADVRGN